MSTVVKASSKSLRVSPRKLSLVAALIRNMKASDAMVQLSFSSKRIAKDVKKCLWSAMHNAENNHGMDMADLIVQSAVVGKSLVMKRTRTRARGRSAGINRFFSNLYLTLVKSKES